jgi:photosystem II stability/assembly factor-like uncharacterized protein
MTNMMRLLVLLLLASPAIAGSWQPYGLTDRPAPIIAAHPAASSPVLVFDANAPLASISPDAGDSWRNVTFDPILSPATEYPAAFIAGTPPQVYLNRYATPLWSPDGGHTWAPPYFPEPSRADSGHGYAIGGVNPENPQEIVTFFGGAISRTTDGGQTWTFEVGPFHATRITVDWIARRIYAWRFDGFAAKPLDGAGPWVTQSPVSYFDALNLIVVASQGGQLRRSPDGGVSFQPVGTELGAVNICAIAFAPSSPSTVYAVDCIGQKTRQVVRSTDSGLTWQRVSLVPAELGGFGDAGTTAIAVDGADPLHVWVGTAWGLHESFNGGDSVERVPRSTGAPGLARRVLFDATNAQRQWLSGRVIRTQDAGATWTMVDTGSFAWSVEWASRTRSNVVIGATRDLTFSRIGLSADGGNTWTDKITVSGRFGSGPHAIVDGAQVGEVYVVMRVNDAAGERILVSFNDGELFEQRAQVPAPVLSGSATRTTPTVLYLGADVGAGAIGLFRSADQGLNVAVVATVPYGGPISAVAVAPSSASTLYIGYKSPNPYPILKSIDAGVTWQPASSGLGTGAITSLAVDPTVPGTAYAVQQGSGVFRTTDGGTTWIALDEGLRGAARNVTSIAIDPRNAQRLFLSTDAGQFTLDLAGTAPLGDRRAIEFYHAAFNHYFVSADLDEIAGLDAGVFQGWARTGESFRVAEGDDAGNQPVCRFFGSGFAPLSSHFYTPYPTECEIVKADAKWQYEKIAFGLALPVPETHGCPPDTRPLFRLWNANRDGAPNHRYTTSMTTFASMRNQEWIFEGEKETRVFACVPE